jgi:uncharacterized damage-inducible protein DinB
MIFNSVAELFDSLEQTRAGIYDSARTLSEEQARFRAADGEWSVAEIAEHISIFESLLLKIVSGLVAKGEKSAALLTGDETVAPISIETITSGTSGKRQAPEILKPTGDIPLERSLENLRQTREALLAFKDRLGARDFTPVTFAQEQVGPLNPYQWIAFIGYHEDRHLNQVTALISSESFPARGAAAV